MTHNNEHLYFPSGRTVAAARADAKKRCRSKEIPLNQALDEIAKENGLGLTWAQSMAYLSEQTQEESTPPGVFSCDSVTLLAIQKAAKAAHKETGRTLEAELIGACRRYGFDDPALAARTLYVSVKKEEVHRVLLGPLLLTLDAGGEDLFINGCYAPTKPTRGYINYDQVVWGDVTVLAEANDGDTDPNGYPLNKGWWLCKYEIGQPRIDLSKATSPQVKYIAHLFGLEPFVIDSEVLRYEGNWNMDQAPIFESVRKWAKAHPRLASQGSSVYLGQWGEKALA